MREEAPEPEIGAGYPVKPRRTVRRDAWKWVVLAIAVAALVVWGLVSLLG